MAAATIDITSPVAAPRVVSRPVGATAVRPQILRAAIRWPRWS